MTNKKEKTIYYTPEMLIQLDGYYKLPKWIMDFNISNGSKVLYALILDRFRMSLKNGWIDDRNRVYMYFSSNDVQELMDVSRKTAYNYFKELIDEDLIEIRRQGAMKANIIYLKALSYEKVVGGRNYQKSITENVMSKNYTSLEDNEVMSKNYPSLGVKITHHDEQKLPNKKKEINKNKSEKDSDSVTDTEYCSGPSKKKNESETETIIDDDFESFVLSRLNDDQYEAFRTLLLKIKKRELSSSKESLLRYFNTLCERGWKDGNGKPIVNIVGYVTMNFVAHMKDIDRSEEYLRRDGYEPGSVYFAYRKDNR